MTIINCAILPLDATSSPTLRVCISIEQEQHKPHHRSSTKTSQHRNLRRSILRGILCLKRLWTKDITNAEAARDNRDAKCTLRLPCDITCCPVIDDRQTGSDRVDEIYACEDAGPIVNGYEGHQGAADDAGDEDGDDPGPSVGGVADAVACDDGGADGDDTGGRVEQS